MAISFAQIASLVVQQLNAAGSYTGTVSSPRWYTNGVRDAIAEADSFVCGVILNSPTSPYIGSFTPTTSTVAHLGLVPSHVGMVVSITIDGEGAVLWPKNDIERELDNPLVNVVLDKHYFLEQDKKLYHNGTTATATYYTFTQSSADPPVLQSPDAFAEVVASKALSFLISVEGENNEAAMFYESHWKSTLAALMGGGQ